MPSTMLSTYLTLSIDPECEQHGHLRKPDNEFDKIQETKDLKK